MWVHSKMLHTFATTSQYAARQQQRRTLVEEWERGSVTNVYDDADDDNESRGSSSMNYARQLITEEDDYSATVDGQDDSNSFQSGRFVGAGGNELNLYDFNEAEPDTHFPRHGAGFTRCFTCWADNARLPKRTYLIIAVSMILVAIVVGCSVVVSKRNNNIHATIDDAPSPTLVLTWRPTSLPVPSPTLVLTQPPTSPPTPSPTLVLTQRPTSPPQNLHADPSFAHGLVSSLLIHFDILDVHTFENLQSPQRLAIEYMLDSTLSNELNLSHFEQDWKTSQVLRNLVEFYSLAVFYYSTLGSEWASSDNWLAPDFEDPCSWYGITCGQVVAFDEGQPSNTISAVTYIKLSDNHLNGTLPLELQFLKDVFELELSKNNLRGDLPERLPESLRVLHLGENRFTNQVPEAWGEHANLKVLDLHENNLQGSLPPFNSLRILNAEHNFLTGNLPTTPSLEGMVLNNNRFSGTISSDLPSQLKELSVRENHLQGFVPESVGQLSLLQVLNLGENYLTGGLEFCSQLVSLNQLYIAKNRFTGGLPSFSAPFLTILVASHNELAGSLPDAIGELSKLATLELDHNRFDGSIPSTIAKLSELKVLNLSENDLVGSLPAPLSSQLETLHLPEDVLIGD